jgi:transcriptional regulator of acetoin/glycerol metabolism
MTVTELDARLHTVRSHYRVSPWIAPRDDEAPLLRSWQRCVDAGMREHECINFELVSRAALADIDQQHGALVRHTRPETERLAQAVRGTGAAVMLFNTRGVVIDRLCHEAATPATLLAASRVGVNVHERCVGTTAPAIALREGLPYLVGRDAHFFTNTRPFFCVAAPIDNPQGERLAALDITTYDSVPGFDVFSLVVDAAAAIENSLFVPGPDQVVVHFHPRAELVGTPMAGLLAVDDGGGVRGANRMAARLLCQARSALIGQPFSALFDRRHPGVFGRNTGRPAELVEMHSSSGLLVLARFEGDAHAAPAGARATTDAGRSAGCGPTCPPEAPPCLRALEYQAIDQALVTLGGNVSAAARQLGISRNTIYRRLQQRLGTG